MRNTHHAARNTPETRSVGREAYSVERSKGPPPLAGGRRRPQLEWMKRDPSHRVAGWFQILVGIGVISWWAVAAATNGIPELEDGRIDIVFHIAAELVMGWLLIAAGFWVLRRDITPRTTMLSGLALGALAYSSINSPGYFAEQRAWWAVGMFATVCTAAAVTALNASVMDSSR